MEETNTWSNDFFHAICHVFNGQVNGYTYLRPQWVGWKPKREEKERGRGEKEEETKEDYLPPLLPAVKFSKDTKRFLHFFKVNH